MKITLIHSYREGATKYKAGEAINVLAQEADRLFKRNAAKRYTVAVEPEDKGKEKETEIPDPLDLPNPVEKKVKK